MPEITGLAHVDLSVTDLDRSEAWYAAVLGARRILEQRIDDPGYAFRVLLGPQSLTALALFRHDSNGADAPGSFDFHRTGMDHFAFAVPGGEALAEWERHLTALNVRHGGIQEDPYASMIVARDPDGIPVEFYHFRASDALAQIATGEASLAGGAPAAAALPLEG